MVGDEIPLLSQLLHSLNRKPIGPFLPRRPSVSPSGEGGRARRVMGSTSFVHPAPVGRPVQLGSHERYRWGVWLGRNTC